MDITTALEVLRMGNIEDQKKIDSRNVAINILENTFQAEFNSISVNRKITEEKVALVDGLQTQVSTITTEKETEKKRADDAEREKQIIADALVEANSRIETLIQENSALTAVNEPVI